MRQLKTALVAATAVFAGIAAFPAASRAAEALLRPGLYDDLLIGYEPSTKTVSGYFFSETGAGQFSCIFYLRGTLERMNAAIESFFPETPRDRIAGSITLREGGQLVVSLVAEHGGCGMVEHFADTEQPATFDLAAAHPWTAIRVVRSKRAYFYDAPDGASHRKAYLIRGNGVGVRSSRPGWLEIDYPDPEKLVSGWMREAEFYSDR